MIADPIKESMLRDTTKKMTGIINNYVHETILTVVLVMTIVILSITTDRFLSFRNIQLIFVVSSCIGIIAIGETFVMIAGGIDLSVGYAAGFGGVLCAILLENGFGAPEAIAVALVFGAALGLFNGMIVTVARVNDFIATLSTMTIIYGLIYSVTKGNSVPVYNKFIIDMGSTIRGVLSVPVIALVILFILGQLILSITKFGWRVYAVGDNLSAAKLSGISTNRLKILTYVICGVMSSWVGVLVAGRLTTAQPLAGSGYLFDVITGVVLGGVSLHGGIGSLFGTFLGVVLIVTIGNGLTLLGFAYYYQSVFQGLILIAGVAITARRR